VSAALGLLALSASCAEKPSPRAEAAAAPTPAPVAVVQPAAAPDSFPPADSVTLFNRVWLRPAGSNQDSDAWGITTVRAPAFDFLQLEHPTGDSAVVIARLILPGKEGAARTIIGQAEVEAGCTLDGKLDLEIIGYFANGFPEKPSQPSQAWRASRERGRFEILDPKRVVCAPESEPD
jgi:hypothetical protein